MNNKRNSTKKPSLILIAAMAIGMLVQSPAFAQKGRSSGSAPQKVQRKSTQSRQIGRSQSTRRRQSAPQRTSQRRQQTTRQRQRQAQQSGRQSVRNSSQGQRQQSSNRRQRVIQSGQKSSSKKTQLQTRQQKTAQARNSRVTKLTPRAVSSNRLGKPLPQPIQRNGRVSGSRKSKNNNTIAQSLRPVSKNSRPSRNSLKLSNKGPGKFSSNTSGSKSSRVTQKLKRQSSRKSTKQNAKRGSGNVNLATRLTQRDVRRPVSGDPVQSTGDHNDSALKHGRPDHNSFIDTIGESAGADLTTDFGKPQTESFYEEESKSMTPSERITAIQDGMKPGEDDPKSQFENALDQLKGSPNAPGSGGSIESDALLGRPGSYAGDREVDMETDALKTDYRPSDPDFGTHMEGYDHSNFGTGFQTGKAETHPGFTNPKATASDDDEGNDAKPPKAEEKSGWQEFKDAAWDFLTGAASGAAGAAKSTGAGTVAGAAATVLTANGDPESKKDEFNGWIFLVNKSNGKRPHQDQWDRIDWGDGKTGPGKKAAPKEDRSPDSIDRSKIKVDFSDPYWLIKMNAKANGNIQYSDMVLDSSQTQTYDGVDYGDNHSEPDNIPEDALSNSVWDDPAVDPNKN